MSLLFFNLSIQRNSFETESTEQIVTWLFYLVIEIIGYLNIWPDADGNSQSHFQSDQR